MNILGLKFLLIFYLLILSLWHWVSVQTTNHVQLPLNSVALPSASIVTFAQGRYQIDFQADAPTLVWHENEEALLTGKVLNTSDLSPTGLTYTLTIMIQGGAATGDKINFPPFAGRGQARFADNLQPTIGTEGKLTALLIRLLGTAGASSNPAEGLGVTYYRDPTTQALVTLTLGDRYTLANMRYTLTGIDMALTGDDCDAKTGPAEPNNYACGAAFIDRVTILSRSGHNLYTPVDAQQVSIVGDVITARFMDVNKNGQPDAREDRRLASTSTRGNVTVFHPTNIGSLLQFSLSDAGLGIDGDPDGYHDFDAPWQGIGLASGITFDVVKLPPAPSSTPDPTLTTITGKIDYLTSVNGLGDDSGTLLPSAEIRLYALESVLESRQVLTTTVFMTVATAGRYRLSGIRAGVPYRIEALVTLPPPPGGMRLNPLRLLRSITPTVAGPNQVDFAVQPAPLADKAKAALLLPDLQPLITFPLPITLAAAARAEVDHDYPGLTRWYLDSESQPGHVLLRFGTLAANIGRGPLHIVGGEPKGASRPIYQRLYTAEGAYLDRRAGRFIFHPGHNHVHMDAFEQYNLRAIDDDRLVAASSKVSFCLTDVLWPVTPTIATAATVAIVPLGWNCGADEQGINVGYSDYYGPALPEQWIDVTDVPNGRYWLEVVVDPFHYLQESDETNNTLRIQIDLKKP